MTLIKLTIELDVKSCQECPRCQTTWGKNSPGGLTLFHMFCFETGRYVCAKQTMGEIIATPPVPTWCPKKVLS